MYASGYCSRSRAGVPGDGPHQSLISLPTAKKLFELILGRIIESELTSPSSSLIRDTIGL